MRKVHRVEASDSESQEEEKSDSDNEMSLYALSHKGVHIHVSRCFLK